VPLFLLPYHITSIL